MVLLQFSAAAPIHATPGRNVAALPISRPYLATMSSPALRFHEASPSTPLLRKPVAGGPPVAASATEVAEVTLANNQAAASTPPFPAKPADPTAGTPEEKPTETAAAAAPQPKPILPDDTPRRVQSQDFLPLFRFPGSSQSPNDVDVVLPGVPTPPAPGTLPQSSATYRQY